MFLGMECSERLFLLQSEEIATFAREYSKCADIAHYNPCRVVCSPRGQGQAPTDPMAARH